MWTEVENDSAYEVKIEAFEGPMELLLHLIRQNKVDIYDIPIALITRQYLETLDLMRSLNLSVAGDFLVMAATLLQIKSQMLLPAPEVESEEDDPRHDLVGRLLLYRQFKEVAEVLERREQIWREVFNREPLLPSDAATDEVFIGEVSLYDLLDALKDVVARLPDPSVMEITEETLSVSDRMRFILERMTACESALFDELFDEATTRHQVVVTFWALLEVIRLGLIRVLQIEPCGPIRLFRKGEPEAARLFDGPLTQQADHGTLRG